MYTYNDNGRRKLTQPLYLTKWDSFYPGATASNLWEAIQDPMFPSAVSQSDFARMLRADAWQTAGSILKPANDPTNPDAYVYTPDEFSRGNPESERMRLLALYITDFDWMDLAGYMIPYLKANDIEGAKSLYVQQLRDVSVNFSPAITPEDAFTRSLRANTTKTVTGLPGDEPAPNVAAIIVFVIIVFVLAWILQKPRYPVVYMPVQPVF